MGDYDFTSGWERNIRMVLVLAFIGVLSLIAGAVLMAIWICNHIEIGWIQ